MGKKRHSPLTDEAMEIICFAIFVVIALALAYWMIYRPVMMAI